MKNLLLFVIMIGYPFIINAQSNYEDVVYLKNGSIIKGLIIEQIPNESLKIQTKDRNVFVYRLDEVLKITKEEVETPQRGRTTKVREKLSKENRKKVGYTNITELTFARSFREKHTNYYNGSYWYDDDSRLDNVNNGPSLGIQTVNGYQFSSHFSFGAGIGLNIYQNLAVLPLFLDFRTVIFDNNVSPYIAVQLGNSFTRHDLIGGSFNYEDEGGVMGSLAAGVKLFVLPRMALNMSLGFRYQELKMVTNTYSFPNYSTEYSILHLRQYNIRFGFTF